MITIFCQLIKFSPLAAIKGQLATCWDAGKRDRGVKFNELPPLLFIQSHPTVYKWKPVREDVQSPSTGWSCSIFVRGGFISKWISGRPIAPLLSVYWFWSMQDADILFFIPAWHCTDCLSACHLRGLKPDTDSTRFGQKMFFYLLCPCTHTCESGSFKNLQGHDLVDLWNLITMSCLGREWGVIICLQLETKIKEILYPCIN